MNGIGVRLAKEKPSVWLLLPERPTTQEAEKSYLERQWKSHYAWWLWWLWWFFCWRHGAHFKRLITSPHRAVIPIDELNRLLGGDAKCSLHTLNDELLGQTVHQLAPQSTLHLFPLSAFPSYWEKAELKALEKTIKEKGHSVIWVQRPTMTESWFEILSQWIRYNVLTQSNDEPLHHIVLFKRRQLEDWNGFTNTTDKQRFLLEQELSTILPTCKVKVLLNAPVSNEVLSNIPQTERILYGFIDSFGAQEDILHPSLTRSNLTPLQPHPESIFLLRMLRQYIWDSTGYAP